MFSGTIESRSHEGGLLVHFEGSSPALNAIMVRADDGVYIGKVDGVLGTTAHALAHVAHIDRSLDMDALVGVNVTVRAKQKRKEHAQRDDRRGGRDRFDNRGQRDGQGRRNDGQQRSRYDKNDRRQDRRGDSNRNSGNGDYNDWTCPECNNSRISV